MTEPQRYAWAVCWTTFSAVCAYHFMDHPLVCGIHVACWVWHLMFGMPRK